jgi:hypothetical protein
MPAAVMFLMALWKRIDPYGLTELRVLGLLLGSWLLGIALLFTLRRDHGIQVIPVSLAVLLLATLFGPLGVTGLSVRSQARRLRAVVTRNGLGGHIAPREPIRISEDDYRTLDGAIGFLLAHRDTISLREVIGGSPPGLDTLADSARGRDRGHDRGRGRWRAGTDGVTSEIVAWLGVSPESRRLPDKRSFGLTVRPDSPALRIAGYDYVMTVASGRSVRALDGADSVEVVSDTAPNRLRVTHRGETLITFALDTLLQSALDDLGPSHSGYVALPAERLRVAAEGGGYRGLLVLTSVYGTRTRRGFTLNVWNGELFLAVPR